MGCKSLIELGRGVAAVLLCTWLVACGGGEGEPPDDEDDEVPATYQLKVSVLGLKGTGLVLSNAEGILEIPTDGTFAFAAPLEAGSNYFVKIVTQPTGPQQTCSLGNPGGQDIHADATVFVTCVDHVPMKAVINGFQADSLEVLLSNAPDSSQCCNLAATLIVTENGEHGASAIRTMAPGALSWCCATSLSESARISSSSCTTESGGRPPSFWDRLIEPRVGWKRTPSSRAAVISAEIRSPPPRGWTYR